MAAFPSLLTVSCVSLLTSAILLHFPLLLSLGVTGWVCFTPDSQASSICTVILLPLSSMMLVFGLSQRIKIKLPSHIPFKYLCHIMSCHRRKLLCVKLKLTLSRILILTKVNLSSSKIYLTQNTKQYFSMTSNLSTSMKCIFLYTDCSTKQLENNFWPTNHILQIQYQLTVTW